MEGVVDFLGGIVGIRVYVTVKVLLMLRTRGTGSKSIGRSWWWRVCDRARARVQVGGPPIYRNSRTCVIQMRSFFPTRKSALALPPLQRPGALQGDLVSFAFHLGLMPHPDGARCGYGWKRTSSPLFFSCLPCPSPLHP